MIPIILSSFFRLYPVDLPATEDWARDSVERHLGNQVKAQIDQQYPNLPDANKQALIEQEIQQIYATQGDSIQTQIKGTADYFRSKLQDENGHTYLLAIDPYLWYSLSRNFLEDPSTGFGDMKNDDGKNIFSLRNGRMDMRTTDLKFVPTFNIIVYKILSVFDRDITLMRAVFFVPVILIALSIIPAFFLGRQFGGNISGLFSGLIIALNGSLLSRTPAGFSDTDAYNILFPLFIVWTFVLAMKAKDMKNTFIYSGLTGALFGLYAMSWAGWGHVLVILIATLGVVLFYHLAVNRDEIFRKGLGQYFKLKRVKTAFATLITMFISSLIFVSITRGLSTFFNAGFKVVLGFITLKEVAVTTLWPNVLTTVAEFNEVPLSNIVSQMGGLLFFLIALIGISAAFFMSKKGEEETMFQLTSISLSALWYGIILISLLKQEIKILTLMLLIAVPFLVKYVYSIWKKKKGLRIEHSALLLIWFIATLYSFTNGTRFAILLVPSFAVAFGVTIGIVYNTIVRVMDKEFGVDRKISQVILVVGLLSLLMYQPIVVANNISKSEMPSMNDAWYDSLRSIHDASEDAIITSWWDFGHWFFSISERRVTFDGANQGRRIHWVGKSLLENDEDLAIGILRMLNCGQEDAFKVFNKNFNNLDKYDPSEPRTVETIALMDDVMSEPDREKAKKIMIKAGFSDAGADETLEYTHCEDLIDQYYIISDDMVGKSGVWAHFGSWDFERALTWQTVSKISDREEGISVLMDDFGISDRIEAENMYTEIRTTKADRWVAEWPSYASGVSNCVSKGAGITCDNGLEVDFSNRNATISTQQGRVGVNTLVYPEDDVLKTVSINPDIPYSAILIPTGNGQFKSILATPEIAGSMFTRLFFLNGHGLKHFKLHTFKQSVTNNQIYVYKVEWEPQDPNIMDALIPPLEIYAAHILVETEEEAEEIIRLLEEGTDFGELAKERSIGPSNETGGILGWFGKGSMVAEFEEAAFALEVGEISAVPVKTQFGFHVIKVFDQKGGKVEETPTEEVVEDPVDESTEDAPEEPEEEPTVENISEEDSTEPQVEPIFDIE